MSGTVAFTVCFPDQGPAVDALRGWLRAKLAEVSGLAAVEIGEGWARLGPAGAEEQGVIEVGVVGSDWRHPAAPEDAGGPGLAVVHDRSGTGAALAAWGALAGAPIGAFQRGEISDDAFITLRNDLLHALRGPPDDGDDGGPLTLFNRVLVPAEHFLARCGVEGLVARPARACGVSTTGVVVELAPLPMPPQAADAVRARLREILTLYQAQRTPSPG